VPAAAVLLLTIPFVLPPSSPRRHEPLPDPLGAGLIVIGVSLVVLGIVQSSTWGWVSAATIGSMSGGLLTLGLLILRCNHHPHPILDLSLLRIRSVALGDAGVIVFGLSLWILNFGLILFMINAWDFSAGHTGLVALPMALVGAAAGIVSGHLASRFSHRLMGVVGALSIAGVAVIVLSVDTAEPRLSWMLPATILLGWSAGVGFNVFTAAGVLQIAPERHAIASGVNFTCNRIGAAIGLSLAVTFLSDPTMSLTRGLDVAAVVTLVATGLSLVISLALDI